MRQLVIALSAFTMVAGAALADEQVRVAPSGMSINVGAGVGGFTDESMREYTGGGRGWNARFLYGTRSVLGFEVAYLGGVQSVDAFLLDSDARLLSTAFETDFRFNPTRLYFDSPVHPYLFLGVGYIRYDLTNADINLSSVEDQDALFEVPMGIGATYALDHFQLDVRASYRPAWDADLLSDAKEGTGLASWGLNLQVGYEF